MIDVLKIFLMFNVGCIAFGVGVLIASLISNLGLQPLFILQVLCNSAGAYVCYKALKEEESFEDV